MYTLDDYDYELPETAIAQEAVHPPHDAKIMVINQNSGEIIEESTFWHLDTLVPLNRVFYFNDSRVLPARIRLHGNTITLPNGSIQKIEEGEILFLQKRGEGFFEALVRPGKKFKIGSKLFLDEGTSLEVVEETEYGRMLRAHGKSIESIMRNFGELPLPPYVEYTKEKEQDYQTIFAEKDGSVAAPTASLHFTTELLSKLKHERRTVTLHVGMGTFQNVKVTDIREHNIHRELAEVPRNIFETIAREKQSGKKILAVGTTVCRTLESLVSLWSILPEDEKGRFSSEVQSFWGSFDADIHSVLSLEIHESSYIFETRIYLYPGKKVSVIDELITNFHLPKSTLIMLVSTLLTREKTLAAYIYALRHGYRFFSFGDGMYLKQ